jgi:hypothetical protein
VVTQDQGQVPTPASPLQRIIAGRYAVIAEIGRGGMGIVWLAEDRTIGRRVAIKELHLPDGVPPDERGVFEERVLREARTAGRLNDPAVVTVYDVLQELGNTYIVMELIQAPTLSDLVKKSGPLPQDAVAGLATQLLSALEAAHHAGIVHRDVKPSNVMVLPNGRVKLTDFGIAQSLDDPRLTTSGILIGSPTYIAPERIQGADAEPASDLWSLGQVLFFAVEGYSPYERPTTAATMHAIISEVPYLTRSQGPLASVIMGLLISNPQARLRAEQVRGLLAQTTGPNTGPQPVMYGPARYAHPPAGPTVVTTAPRPGPPVKRDPAKILALVGLVVLLAAGAFVGGLFTGKSITPDGPSVEAARGEVFTWGKGGDIPSFEVSPPGCGAAPLAPGRSVTSASDCDDPHDFQVYAADAAVSSSLDIDYPGKDRLAAYGQAWCGLLFASKLVSPETKATDYTYITLVPSEDVWRSDKTGGHYVACVVRKRDSKQFQDSVVVTR